MQTLRAKMLDDGKEQSEVGRIVTMLPDEKHVQASQAPNEGRSKRALSLAKYGNPTAGREKQQLGQQNPDGQCRFWNWSTLPHLGHAQEDGF